MKKLILSVLVLGTFSLYSIHLKNEENETPIIAVRQTTTASPSAQPQATSFPQTLKTPAPTLVPTVVPKGRYKDGSFTGNVTDAFYGNLQVSVTVTGGKISDVKFLQYPNDRRTSVEINTQAMPLLRQEAIIAQSAKVDGVSGATQTSAAFIQSLQSALDKAV